jgi:hypothetical protein
MDDSQQHAGGSIRAHPGGMDFRYTAQLQSSLVDFRGRQRNRFSPHHVAQTPEIIAHLGALFSDESDPDD